VSDYPVDLAPLWIRTVGTIASFPPFPTTGFNAGEGLFQALMLMVEVATDGPGRVLIAASDDLWHSHAAPLWANRVVVRDTDALRAVRMRMDSVISSLPYRAATHSRLGDPLPETEIDNGLRGLAKLARTVDTAASLLFDGRVARKARQRLSSGGSWDDACHMLSAGRGWAERGRHSHVEHGVAAYARGEVENLAHVFSLGYALAYHLAEKSSVLGFRGYRSAPGGASSQVPPKTNACRIVRSVTPNGERW
jgi:hypothetical protein